MTPAPTMFVVDDDPDVRDSLRELITSVKMPVRTYESAESFLDDCDPSVAGCLLLDVRMPGMSGLELQDKLRQRRCDLPIIIITGHADVPMAVQAIRNGAVDLIEKPFREQVLLDAITHAVRNGETARRQRVEHAATRERLKRLTPREYEVLNLIIDGKQNKGIAAVLGLSHKTVESHRTRIMKKMEATTVADLVRMALVASPPSKA